MSSVPKMAADQLSLRHLHALTSADILLLGGGAFSELARAACAEERREGGGVGSCFVS